MEEAARAVLGMEGLYFASPTEWGRREHPAERPERSGGGWSHLSSLTGSAKGTATNGEESGERLRRRRRLGTAGNLGRSSKGTCS